MGKLLSDIDEHLNVLWFGEAGTGKTTHLLSLAKRGRFVLINNEGGAKVTALRQHGIPVENIEVETPGSYDELEALYWSLKERLDNNEPIVGIGMDSMTEIQTLLVGESVAQRVDKMRTQGKSDTEKANRWFTDRDDYGQWTAQAKYLIRKFRDLPCHFGATALSTRVVDEHSGALKILPQITPAVRTSLLGYVDIVTQTVTAESDLVPDPDGIEYLGVNRNIGIHAGKDRLKMTPVVMANPTFHRLVGLQEGKLDLDKDPSQLVYRRRMAVTTPAPSPESDGPSGGPDDPQEEQ